MVVEKGKMMENIEYGSDLSNILFTDEMIDKQIEDDFRLIIEWQGIAWGEEQDKELKGLIERNRDRFRDHLKEHGDISEFQYVSAGYKDV